MRQKVDGPSRSLEWILAVAVIGSAAGCSDTAGGQGWDFESGTNTADTAEAPPDTGVVPVADAIQPEDTGSMPDTRQPDTRQPDTGGELIDEQGWYVSGFEQSEFIPAGPVYPRGELRDGKCRVQINDTAVRRDRWWAAWTTESGRMSLYPPDLDGRRGSIYGFYDARGKLSERGDYGHLGGYGRKFEITEADLQVCRSVSQLGHCAVPRADQPNCTIVGREEFGRDRDGRIEKRQLMRRRMGTADSSTYTLSLASGGPGYWRIELEITPPSEKIETAKPVPLDSL
ncbi:MAG: hypothetical protein ABEN55_19880, partial [Bradymonadaceae bacterium]